MGDTRDSQLVPQGGMDVAADFGNDGEGEGDLPAGMCRCEAYSCVIPRRKRVPGSQTSFLKQALHII